MNKAKLYMFADMLSRNVSSRKKLIEEVRKMYHKNAIVIISTGKSTEMLKGISDIEKKYVDLFYVDGATDTMTSYEEFGPMGIATGEDTERSLLFHLILSLKKD